MSPANGNPPCFGARWCDTGLIAGALITALGVILLLDQFDVFRVCEVLRYWPVILIMIGLYKLRWR